MRANSGWTCEARPVSDERVIFAFFATEIKAGPVANAAQIGNGAVIQLAANPARHEPAGVDAREDYLESTGQLLLEQGETVTAPQRRMHIHSHRAAAFTNPIRTSIYFRDVAGDDGADAHFISQIAQCGFVTFLERLPDVQNVMRQFQ